MALLRILGPLALFFVLVTVALAWLCLALSDLKTKVPSYVVMTISALLCTFTAYRGITQYRRSNLAAAEADLAAKASASWARQNPIPSRLYNELNTRKGCVICGAPPAFSLVAVPKGIAPEPIRYNNQPSRKVTCDAHVPFLKSWSLVTADASHETKWASVAAYFRENYRGQLSKAELAQIDGDTLIEVLFEPPPFHVDITEGREEMRSTAGVLFGLSLGFLAGVAILAKAM